MYKRKSASIVPKQWITASSSSSPEADDSASAHEEADSKSYASFAIDPARDYKKSQAQIHQNQQPTQTPSQSQAQSQPSQQRSVGSLVLLTQKFVELMKQNGGSIDLKEVKHCANVHLIRAAVLNYCNHSFQATKILDVQKRRIYDITNVLEGIGLIDKGRHCSLVRWRGGGFTNAKDRRDYDLACERTDHLKSLEEDLDKQLEYAQRNLQFIMQDPTNQSYAYLTRDDLLNIYGDDSVFTIPNYDEEVEIQRNDNELRVSLDNGSTIDIRLVTNQGKGTANPNDADRCFDERHLDTSPSPSSSPTHSSDAGAGTGTGNVIKDEHTYSCDPEMKDEMKALENELTAKIIFQNYMAGHSLRRFFPDDPNLENPPLVQLNPPQEDFNFVLKSDEGICELFDVQC
ncbi:hypothetical protein KR222_011096 [Zaprionus bogoriensis]|nr:hypothetical protein KR222_011096 [Zaprionus bogoriensis]